jgi:hypothetical protein
VDAAFATCDGLPRINAGDRNGAVGSAGRFTVMELDFNEPCLFSGSPPGAAGRVAEAIVAVFR